jgi:hypothetical protein
MISQAITLSVLTFAGFFIIYGKLPQKIRDFLEQHSLLADALATGGTYVLLGGTLTALLASAMTGLLVSTGLYVSNNPEKFEYLSDLKAAFQEGLQKINEYIADLSHQYREYKEAK